ncbi:MAG: DsbC family protein [Dissulfurispiraceae bacterium]|jgi:thiol:disulfide interchange protein DsbC
MRRYALAFVLVFALTFAVSLPGYAFSTGGCEGDCNKCHSLTYEDALGILRKMNSNAKITSIQISPVKGLWEVSIDDNGRKGFFYTDFSKKFLIAGPIVELDNATNSAPESVDKLQDNRKVDVSKIPLDNALILGDQGAKNKVIVFTDPECPFCARLHKEMKRVVAQRKDIVFLIKLFPLAAHKDSYWKANSIECKKSLKMMDDNFEGKPIQKFACAAKEIDDNLRIAQSLGITGTPTLILPDGRVHMGTLPADKLIDLINGK